MRESVVEAKPTPYLGRGMYDVETESSVLRSSSKYLNSAALRDWIATHYLRRNGPDRPTPSDNVDLTAILAPLRDKEHIEALFEAERRINPQLDRWLSERFLSNFTLEDLKGLGPETFGGMFYRQMTQPGFDYELGAPARQPKTHYGYWWTRGLQCHDWLHVLCGAQFTSMGEIVVYWAQLSNHSRFLSPELCGELQVKTLLGGLRFLSRALLHYPETWPTVIAAMEKGMRIGQASDCLLFVRMEDAFHLPLDEARQALGVRQVGPPLETSEASAIFDEVAPRRSGLRAVV